MLTYKTEISNSDYPDLSVLSQLHNIQHSPHKCLYLDIETTGFNRNYDMLYLVGLITLEKGDAMILTQLLCTQKSDEYELLFTLNNLCLNYSCLLHFNGDNFDVPFIKARMELYKIKENISTLRSFDYFKELKPLRRIFGTDNFKLKTLEKLAGFIRNEPYNGGELIRLYEDFLRDNRNSAESFILHNKADMLGLFYLNSFNPLFKLLETSPTSPSFYTNLISTTTDAHYLISDLNFCDTTPSFGYTFDIEYQGYHLFYDYQTVELRLPLSTGTYKYFFQDFRDYYYLPNEDYSVHKIVATSVSSKHRRQATKGTAYIKKEGTFIQCPLSSREVHSLLSDNFETLHIFQESFNSDHCYILPNTFKDIEPYLFLEIIRKLFI